MFTETAGCNAVILDSVANLDEVMDALAFGLCWFSGQMCTAPQNIFVPESGVRVGDKDGTLLSAAQVEAALVQAIDRLLATPARCASILGSLVDPDLIGRMQAMQDDLENKGMLVRAGVSYVHPQHPTARTASPLIGT